MAGAYRPSNTPRNPYLEKLLREGAVPVGLPEGRSSRLATALRAGFEARNRETRSLPEAAPPAPNTGTDQAAG
ncbi:MAG: hypothetical protein IT536_13845 [Hyphomicrobiales bacterium]|nr:hypothetical protein [Hyphomicrobiales bacterium]